MMPHSFSVLNWATCASNKLACAPNHGCQIFTWTPCSASFWTFKLLAAGVDVFASDALSVPFADGVGVLELVDIVDVHADRKNNPENKTTRGFLNVRMS